MRTLICIQNFFEWAGAELVAIEMSEDLRGRGWDVQVFAPFLRPTFAQDALGQWRDALNDPKKIDVTDYDLILVLHQGLSRLLPFQDLENLAAGPRPFIAYFHLSPFEPFEGPGVFAERVLGDVVFANSEETRNSLAKFGFQDVALFQNPAPATFGMTSPPSASLERVLCVSSHPPAEVSDALDILRAQGVEVFQLGKGQSFRRVRPYHIMDHDAVITIGKTVQYALRAGRPVYCYDHFEGPGWAHHDFAANEASNFSGRSERRPRNGADIADDLVTGYADARAWSVEMAQTLPDRFKLEACMDAIVNRLERSHAKPTASISDPRGFAEQILSESAVYDLVDRTYANKLNIPNYLTAPMAKTAAPMPQIETRMLRAPDPGCATVMAVFSYRYDAHLVPELLDNIGSSIHGYVAWDDRQAPPDQPFTDETTRQLALFEAAQEAGADWLFAADPDERFEDALAAKIGNMTNESGPVIWTFDCREVFETGKFRSDGMWGQRQRARLFPCVAGMEPDRREFHGLWTGNALKLKLQKSGLSFYHLRMMAPERRRLRKAQYSVLDPKRASQSVGYDYLDDERGMQLREIAPERQFSPDFTDDGGLWAASDFVDAKTVVPSDPPKAMLRRLHGTWLKGGYASASYVGEDLLCQTNGDQEVALWAASSALDTKNWGRASALAKPVAERDPESLWSRLILAQAYCAQADAPAARAALDEVDTLAEATLFATQIRQKLSPAQVRFSGEDAVWRRWVKGDASIHQGELIEDAPICVIVLSMGAPLDVVAAVESLLNSTVRPEIVVVNSNGGDIMGRLAQHLDHVRIISTNTRLFPGAARNVGIDASSAEYVSFLASDCTVGPANLETRLHLHQKGARAVSGSVAPQDPGSLTQTIASLVLHPNRHPQSRIARNTGYSLSLERGIFGTFGYFPPTVRIGEDTFLRRNLEDFVEIETHPAIYIDHSYPDDLAQLDQDIRDRAALRVLSFHFPVVRSVQDLQHVVNAAHDDRLNLSLRELQLRSGAFRQTDLPTIKAQLKRVFDIERQTSLQVGRRRLEARQTHRTARSMIASDPDAAKAKFLEVLGVLPEHRDARLSLSDLSSDDEAGHPHDRLAQLEAVIGVDPSDAKALMKAMDVNLSVGDVTAARNRFELSCLMMPNQKSIWARHAPLPGNANRPMRVMALQKMFCLDPFDAGTSRTLSENYEHAGNFSARDARRSFIKTVLE